MRDTFSGFVQEIEENFKDQIIFRDSRYQKLAALTGRQYAALIQHTEQYLNDNKLVTGSKVVSFIESGIIWNVIDVSVMSSGGVHVALSPTLEDEDINKFIAYLNPAAIVYSSPVIEKRIRKILAAANHTFVLIDARQLIEGFDRHSDTLSMPNLSLKGNDIASIMFTSGTSGSAKAIVHTHEKMLQNIQQTVYFYAFEKGLKALSFLPLHYAYERMYNYVFQQSGVTVHYANPSLSLWENILEVRPDLVTIVPVFLVELNNILSSTEHRSATDLKSWIDQNHPVFICSGAPLSKDVYESLTSRGCGVYDMYGSTETLIVSANSGKDFKAGSVGKVIEHGRVCIADDGEVLVNNIMQGYFYPAEQPAELPYYRTGDSGSLEDGFLRIEGRKKNLFKNAHGVYINPVEIEESLSKSGKVKNIVVTEHLGGIAAIIESSETAGAGRGDLLLSVQQFNAGQLANKLIKYIAFSDVEWSSGNGFLTLSSKPRREYIYDYFKHKLEEISE